MKIFDVKIDNYSEKELLKKLTQKLNSQKFSRPLFLTTLNPEILLTAKKNRKYHIIINSANIKIMDGFGIKILSWLKKKPVGARITGADLSEVLLEKATQLNLKIGVIYLEEGLSSKEEIKKSLKRKGKNIKLIGVTRENFLKKDLKKFEKYQLILVAIGHPYQEILIYRKILKLKGVKIALGIGGTLDYWTNRRKRAPKILCKVGLEWLWRLAIQPNRIFRVYKSAIKFPVLGVLEILSNILFKKRKI